MHFSPQLHALCNGQLSTILVSIGCELIDPRIHPDLSTPPTTDSAWRSRFSITAHPIIPRLSIRMIGIRAPSKPRQLLDLFLSKILNFRWPEGLPWLDLVVLIVDRDLGLWRRRQRRHSGFQEKFEGFGLLNACIDQKKYHPGRRKARPGGLSLPADMWDGLVLVR